MDLKGLPVTMSNDENKCDKIQPSTISKNKSAAIESVIAPEVKILNRGDLLGAINCLFPELQLKSGHSLQELTSILESGRKYRSRAERFMKCSTANQVIRSSRSDTYRMNLKSSSVTSENVITASKTWKNNADKIHNNYETGPSSKCDTPSFQSSYTDFTTKFLESNFPDRFIDFKNIECIIIELNNLFKEMAKEDRIGPFNPNLPVLNISECDKIVRTSSEPKDFLKASACVKRICSKRKSKSRTQIEFKGRRKKSIIRKSQCARSARQIKTELRSEGCEDENGKGIERNIEDLLSDDTFSPRYKAKHTSGMFVIYRKLPNRNDSIVFSTLEQEAIEQYENGDTGAADMNFNLFEMK